MQNLHLCRLPITRFLCFWTCGSEQNRLSPVVQKAAVIEFGPPEQFRDMHSWVILLADQSIDVLQQYSGAILESASIGIVPQQEADFLAQRDTWILSNKTEWMEQGYGPGVYRAGVCKTIVTTWRSLTLVSSKGADVQNSGRNFTHAFHP